MCSFIYHLKLWLETPAQAQVDCSIAFRAMTAIAHAFYDDQCRREGLFLLENFDGIVFYRKTSRLLNIKAKLCPLMSRHGHGRVTDLT